MKYLPDIRAASNAPQQLEQLYQVARKEQGADEFAADLLACYHESSDNVLYAAWYYRLQQAAQEEPAGRRGANWKLAVPLSLLTGLIFWLLSDDQGLRFFDTPYLLLFWSAIATLVVIGFLAFTVKGHYRRSVLVGAGLAGLSVYVLLLALKQGAPGNKQYLDLMVLHIPLLAWIAVGISVMGLRTSAQDRLAFLGKSIEVYVTAGVYLIAGVVFVVITQGMFEALNITIPDVLLRLMLAGGFGLIPVLAVASVYDPLVSPVAQEFGQGLGKIVTILMRLLLPLTILVLVIYLGVIPFNFMEPFKNRDVLIVYNAMLFAVMGLLIGVTPVRADDLSPRYQAILRSGILAVATLAVLVSLYALSATVYRTALMGGFTVNRLTVIGWNVVNIGILALLIYKQFRHGRRAWVDSLHATFSIGAIGYVAWALFLTLAIPWLF